MPHSVPFPCLSPHFNPPHEELSQNFIAAVNMSLHHLREYMRGTTLHGFVYLVEEKSVVVRLIWLVLIVVAFILWVSSLACPFKKQRTVPLSPHLIQFPLKRSLFLLLPLLPSTSTLGQAFSQGLWSMAMTSISLRSVHLSYFQDSQWH